MRENYFQKLRSSARTTGIIAPLLECQGYAAEGVKIRASELSTRIGCDITGIPSADLGLALTIPQRGDHKRSAEPTVSSQR